jgi:solute carrier family 25 citrate transporter 1
VQAPKRGFIKTGSEIVKRETALGLYKGLGAVFTGIVPKMAIRFTSYEFYKQMLADQDGMVTSKSTFLGMSILLCRQLLRQSFFACESNG